MLQECNRDNNMVAHTAADGDCRAEPGYKSTPLKVRVQVHLTAHSEDRTQQAKRGERESRCERWMMVVYLERKTPQKNIKIVKIFHWF